MASLCCFVLVNKSWFVRENNICMGCNCIFCCRNMIKLFKVKEKQRELAENAINGIPTKKQSAGELRLHKGLAIKKVYLVLYI